MRAPAAGGSFREGSGGRSAVADRAELNRDGAKTRRRGTDPALVLATELERRIADDPETASRGGGGKALERGESLTRAALDVVDLAQALVVSQMIDKQELEERTVEVEVVVDRGELVAIGAQPVEEGLPPRGGRRENPPRTPSALELDRTDKGAALESVEQWIEHPVVDLRASREPGRDSLPQSVPVGRLVDEQPEDDGLEA
jgi:hypothetical protein